MNVIVKSILLCFISYPVSICKLSRVNRLQKTLTKLYTLNQHKAIKAPAGLAYADERMPDLPLQVCRIGCTIAADCVNFPDKVSRYATGEGLRRMQKTWTLALAGLAALLLVVPPTVYYRLQYAHAKRLRVVTPGVLYRSGQLTSAGLQEALVRFGIRTVINLQDEEEDPELEPGLSESALCRRLGVRYVYAPPDLVDHVKHPQRAPDMIRRFLEIMDDPANWPVLVHCRAGLHRTGVVVALYRIEYQGWSKDQAIAELKANGFGDSKCNDRNEYIVQYILQYQPRSARAASACRPSVER